jgi:small subunit ribosomal protein S2
MALRWVWRRRPRLPHGAPVQTRTFLTDKDPSEPLSSSDDWASFIKRRGEYKSLGESGYLVQKIFGNKLGCTVEEFSDYGSTQTRDNTFQPHHRLHKPSSPMQLTLSTLMASGAHLGHSQALMNSNFLPYAYGERAGITIIDLERTLTLFRRAANFTRALAARNGTIVFIGTRPDLRNVVRKAAERVGSQGYYVGERWIPGTLTNMLLIHGVNAVKNQRVVPDLVIVLNPLSNMNAIRECAIEHVPTIGIVDSNVDPRIVMYPIPANDESTQTAELVAGVLSIAGREGAAIWGEENRKRRKMFHSSRENVTE